MIVRIERADDPRVADYGAIPEPELVRRRGLFVAEGRLVVSRLLEQQRFGVRSLLVNDAALEGLRPLVERRPDVPVYVTDTDTLIAIGGYNFHRGCLALGERGAARAVEEVLGDPAPADRLLVLEGLSQADNVGSAFRNAAAFGVRGVLLDPACCDPLYRKALRTSMGTVLQVPFARITAWPDGMAAVRRAGYTIVALTPSADAIPIAELAEAQAGRPLAVLAGAEGAGLSPGALAHADVRARIPISPAVDSLNVATAIAIALHRVSA
ncbi:MAG TPA: RNA methyltransferase [Vicinamibacterales bacterium]